MFYILPDGIWGVPIVTTRVTLLPFKGMWKDLQVNQNLPLVEGLSVNNSVRTFLFSMKPRMFHVDVFKGCGNTLCDATHCVDENITCPTVSKTKAKAYVMTCVVKLDDSQYIDYSSRSLAKFFMDPTTYEENNVEFKTFREHVDKVMQQCSNGSWIVSGWSKLQTGGQMSSDEVKVHITTMFCVTPPTFIKYTGKAAPAPPS